MRRAAIAAATLALLPATASAAYEPQLSMSIPTGGGPSSPAALSTSFTQALGEEPTKTVEATIPGTFGFNAGFDLKGCAPAEEQADACPESSRIGVIDADAFGLKVSGKLYLTEDFRIHGVISGYGLVRISASGVLRVGPGQKILVRFADLPPVPVARIGFALEGGNRTPLALPRDCGKHTIEVVFTSHLNTVRKREHTIDVEGCSRLPRVDSARAVPSKVRRGSSSTLRWTVGQGVTSSSVQLLHLRDGRWRELGARKVKATRLKLGPKWRGRSLRRGRYEAHVVAIGSDGQRSLAKVAKLTVR